MGRPLGPSGGRWPGGGGTGLPEGLSGGRARGRSGAGGAAVSEAWAAGLWAAGAWVVGAWVAGAWVAGAWAAADWAAGACAAGACGGAAGGAVGRLLIRRDGRGATSSPPVAGPLLGADAGGAATARAGAFFSGAVLGAVAPDEVATAFLAGGELLTGVAVSAAGAAVAATAFLVVFLAAAGSSGWTGRRSPSASALRRTAIGLRVLDRRRVALHPDAQGQGQFQALFIGEA